MCVSVFPDDTLFLLLLGVTRYVSKRFMMMLLGKSTHRVSFFSGEGGGGVMPVCKTMQVRRYCTRYVLQACTVGMQDRWTWWYRIGASGHLGCPELSVTEFFFSSQKDSHHQGWKSIRPDYHPTGLLSHLYLKMEFYTFPLGYSTSDSTDDDLCKECTQ